MLLLKYLKRLTISIIGLVSVSMGSISCVSSMKGKGTSPSNLNLVSVRPPDIVLIQEVIPRVRVDLMYLGSQNFLGRPVVGYKKNRGYLTKPAVDALARVQNILERQGYSLLIRDAYRPQKAVHDFVRWSEDSSDNKMKAQYYPDIPKQELFERGYIARKSGHSRGSTVDLTLWDLKNSKEVDMGTILDFLGEQSHTDWIGTTSEQRVHRQLLKQTMEAQGFKNYSQEWWHFTLEGEPYPQTYFDFDVE